MIHLTDVVKNILIINVLFFVIVFFFMPSTIGIWALHYPNNFQPYQLVTHMFMHGSPTHILFNMFGLYTFGPAIETYYNSKKFGLLYLVAGFGAILIHLLVLSYEIRIGQASLNNSVVGASGAVMGIVAAYATIFPKNLVSIPFLPIMLPARTFIIGYVAMDLVLGLSNANTGIAHFAHLGGALFGFLLVWYWQRYGNDFRRV